MVSQYKRKKVYEKSEGKCVECGTTENLTVDHIFPLDELRKMTWVNKEQRNDIKNLQAMCKECNIKKGNKVDRGYNLSS